MKLLSSVELKVTTGLFILRKGSLRYVSELRKKHSVVLLPAMMQVRDEEEFGCDEVTSHIYILVMTSILFGSHTTLRGFSQCSLKIAASHCSSIYGVHLVHMMFERVFTCFFCLTNLSLIINTDCTR